MRFVVTIMLLVSLLVNIASCETDTSQIQDVSKGFIAYMQQTLRDKYADVSFEAIDYKFSEVINGECNVEVVSVSPTRNGQKQMGAVHLKLKKYNGSWTVYQYGVTSSSDKYIAYETLPVPIGERELKSLLKN